ncbi:potassium:proton antiporter [Pseudodesulfovibrio sediminis]|uniref:Uncharacterized protein n=1 Tax=Pseudodesulfovibrio sediminis TaxID=2810563 RepID=A0ABM7P3J9_9BACT|nr:potassium:proton antiporter [Pseudodesulfovibrio sediminis]BCS87426.1 hypothetical protein PSDVSF_06680 [Pseudodesulfovibrio sediminis]
MGFISWIGCLLVLGYQAGSWVLFKAWPSITLLDLLQIVFGIDLLSLIQHFSLEVAFKAAYVCFTTELVLFLWWLGVVMFALMIATQILFKK